MTNINDNELNEISHCAGKMSEQEIERIFEESDRLAIENMEDTNRLYVALCEVYDLVKQRDDSNAGDDNESSVAHILDVITSGLCDSLSEIQSSLKVLHMLNIKRELRSVDGG